MTDGDDRGPPRQPQRRYLSQSIAALFVAVDEVHVELSTAGGVNDETRSQLQSELASLIFQLRQYRNEDGVDWKDATPFESPDAMLEKMLQGRETTTVPTGQHNAKPQRQREAVQFDAATLYEAALDMIDMVRELGLSAEIDQTKDGVEVEI